MFKSDTQNVLEGAEIEYVRGEWLGGRGCKATSEDKAAQSQQEGGDPSGTNLPEPSRVVLSVEQRQARVLKGE